MLKLVHVYARLRYLNPFRTKDTAPVNRYRDFKEDGAVVLRDRRGTVKAEIPHVDEKGGGIDDDSLAIYRSTGARTVDVAKAKHRKAMLSPVTNSE